MRRDKMHLGDTPTHRRTYRVVCGTTLCAAVLLLSMIVCLVSIPSCSDAHGFGRDASAKPRANEVLVFTDNSPGAIVLADSAHHTVRAQGHATIVTTDEGEFIRRLSQKRWSSVLIATRYSSPTPSYAAALRRFVDRGGWAQIFTWREDADARVKPDSVILAPTAIQVWSKGATSMAYIQCRQSPDPVNLDGYVFGDFKKIESGPVVEIPDPACTRLRPGPYAALEANADVTAGELR